MAYFQHSDSTLNNAFDAFVSFHYPDATAVQLIELRGAGSICYHSKRGWLSCLNNDIDEEALHTSLYAVHNHARKLRLSYRDGIAGENPLLRRVLGLYGRVSALNPHSVYGEGNADTVSISVPASQVPFIEQQLEVMALLEQ